MECQYTEIYREDHVSDDTIVSLDDGETLACTEIPYSHFVVICCRVELYLSNVRVERQYTEIYIEKKNCFVGAH